MTAGAEVFEYAVLRVIPRVDRGEAMNAGILLYCKPLRYLGARVALDAGLLRALEPEADVPGVERALAAVAAVCETSTGETSTGQNTVGGNRAGETGAGENRAGDNRAGPAGQQDLGRRFRWLTAPRSTVVQAGPVHTGLTRDPGAEIERLLRTLVLRPRSAGR